MPIGVEPTWKPQTLLPRSDSEAVSFQGETRGFLNAAPKRWRAERLGGGALGATSSDWTKGGSGKHSAQSHYEKHNKWPEAGNRIPYPPSKKLAGGKSHTLAGPFWGTKWTPNKPRGKIVAFGFNKCNPMHYWIRINEIQLWRCVEARQRPPPLANDHSGLPVPRQRVF